MPSTHHLAVPKQQQSLDAALPFLFQIAKAGNKQFYTTYGLVACLGKVKEGEITFYAIDRALLRAIRAFINRPAITIDNVQEQVKQAKELDSLLVEERGRISKLMKSLWFYQRGKRRYITKWKQMIKSQQAQLYKHIRLLQHVANYAFTGQAHAVDILPFKTVFRALNGNLVEIPNALLAFLPSNKRKWFLSDNSAEIINFIMSKHALLQPLHLPLSHPKLEKQQLDTKLRELQAEQRATVLAIKNSSFFAFRWRAFLKIWLQVIKLAIHELEKGQHIWKERLTMRQSIQLDKYKAEIQTHHIALINLEPSQCDDWSVEKIQQAQARLLEVEGALGLQEQAIAAYEQQSHDIDISYLEGLHLFVSAIKEDIQVRQNKFRDKLTLRLRQADLGRIPAWIEDPLQTLELTNFDQHSYLGDLKRYELKWNLLQRQVDNALTFAGQGFTCKESLAEWQQFLIARHNELTQARINIVWLLAEKLYSGAKIDKNQQQRLLAFMALIEAAALPGELSSLQVANLANLKLQLKDLAEEQPKSVSSTCWEAKIQETITQEMELAQKLLAALAGSEQVLDVDSTKWLCSFYCKMTEQNSISTASLSTFNQQQVQKLKQSVATMLLEAEKVCQKRLYEPDYAGKHLLVEAKYVPEILCFGLLCKIGSADLTLRQDKLLQNYLRQELHTIASMPKLTSAEAQKLEAFETILVSLDEKTAVKVQKLSALRQAQNWVGYQESCRQWLALLTQPPVATLAGQSLLSPKSHPMGLSGKNTTHSNIRPCHHQSAKPLTVPATS